MKRIYIVLTLVLLSCNKEKLSERSVVDDNTVQRTYTELDKWIDNELTIPYGIEVNYRWDGNTAQKGSHTYPPEAKNIQKVLEAIKYLWLETYTLANVGGKDFLKGKNPIKIYMYGGKNIDENGVELLANSTTTSAELYLYDVNNFDNKDFAKVFTLMRSVHHQFAKRLMELYPYDRDKFLLIHPKGYVSDTKGLPDREPFSKYIRKFSDCRRDPDATANQAFTYVVESDQDYTALEIGFFSVGKNILTQGKMYKDNCNIVYEGGAPKKETVSTEGVAANRRGFYTIHSMLSAEDDFAEIISTYLTHSAKEMDDAIRIGATPRSSDPADQQEAKEAPERLHQKQQFVEEYFKKEIKINLKRMQTISIQRLKSYVNQ